MSEKLFVRNLDINRNAYPNWRRNNFVDGYDFASYAEMFKDSASKTILSVEDNILNEVDGIIIPALFLYRHSLELVLKAIILTGYLMTDKPDNIIKKKITNHKLDELWIMAKLLVEEHMKEDIKNDSQPFNLMESTIDTFNSLDNRSFIFRYPYNTNLELVYFEQGDPSDAFDYKYLVEKFEDVFNYFNGTFHTIYNHYESQESVRVLGKKT